MRRYFFLILMFSVSACNKTTTSTTNDSENGAEVAATVGISLISGAANSNSSNARVFDDFEDTVTSCTGVAYNDTCDTSTKTKTATYTSCPIESSGLTFSGSIVLTYSRTSCLVAIANDTVTRTVNITRQGTSGSSILTTSDSHSDYRGTTIGGGAKITKTGTNAYEINILGLRKKKTNSSGSTVFDVSTRTTAAMTISFPSSTSVNVSSGTTEVVHNVAKYVATFTASSLVYDYATCCYPSSGTFSVEYSGSLSGTASVAFSSTCGSGTFTRNGSATTLTFPACD